MALPGLTDLIGKLQFADALLDRLEARGTISVNIKVSGTDHLDAATANVAALRNALEGIGEKQVATNLEKGFTTAGEVALWAKKQTEDLGRQVDLAMTKSVQMQGKFESLNNAGKGEILQFARTDKLAAMRQELNANIVAADELTKKYAAMQRVAGLAEGVSGTPKQSDSGPSERSAAAEQKLTTAVAQAAGALTQQDDAARRTVATLGNLNGVTEKAVAVERKLAEAVVRTAEAESVAGETRRRVLRDRSGTIQRQTVTFRDGPGETRTLLGSKGLTSTSIDQVQKYQAEMAAVQAESSSRRAAMFQAGFKKESPEQLGLLRQEAEARQVILDKMNAAGLSGERMYRAETLRVRNLEEMASRQTQMNAVRESAAMRSDIGGKMDTGFRERAAQLDREFSSQMKLHDGRQEEVELLKKHATAYQQLADAMRAGGRGGSPGELGAQKNAEVMTARASQIEAEMARAKQEADRLRQETASMNAKFKQEFSTFGGTEKRTVEKDAAGGKTVTAKAERIDPAGFQQSIEWTRRFDAAGNELAGTLNRTSAALDNTKRSATAAGKSMLDNIVTVSAWALSVGVLYKSLALLEFGAQSMAKLEFQAARLSAVFRGSTGDFNAQSAEIVSLRDKTLELAAANGRGGEEALDAAVRWSRLGLTQREVLEAVDVSLKAANVAEISTSEAAEQLSAVFAAYRLQVGELRTVLNELNTVSNNYNVTNKDLLGGLARTSSIAKQAGLSLAELMGIIGSGVGRTGRSGAEIGNAVKSLIVSLSNPKLQGMLKTDFKFDVKTPGGDLKDMSTLLNEIYLMFQKVDKASQGEFLQKVGGKMQASRLQAIIDGYVTGQMLAIKAQNDLGSAERENEKIRATTLSQLASLSTAYQRLATNMLTVGGSHSIGGEFAMAIELLSNLIRLMGDAPGAVLIITSLFVAMGIKIGVAMMKSAKDTGLLGRTIGHVQSLWVQFAAAVQAGNTQLARHNALAGATPKGGPGGAAAGFIGPVKPAVNTGLKAVGKGLLMTGLGAIFSPEMAVFLAASAAVDLAMRGINSLFKHFSTTAENAADDLAVYNKELERTKAFASAADMSSRLAGTISKAIPTLIKSDPKAASQALDDFAQIAYTREEDPGNFKRSQLKAEFHDLLAIGNVKELQLRLSKEEARFAAQRRVFAGQELQQKAAALEKQALAVALLSEEIEKRKAAGKDVVIQQGKLEEAQRAQAGLRGDVATAYTATYDPGDTNVGDVKAGYVDRFKEQMKGIEAVVSAHASTTTDDEVEKTDRKIYALEQQLKLIEDTKAASEAAGKVAVEASEAAYKAKRQEWVGLVDTKALYDQLNMELAKADMKARDEAEFYRGQLVAAGNLNGKNDSPFWRERRARDDAAERLKSFNADPAAFIETEADKTEPLDQYANFDNRTQAARRASEEARKAFLDLQKGTNANNAALEGAGAAVEESPGGKKKAIEDAKEQLRILREYNQLQDEIASGRRKAKQETTQFQTGTSQTAQLLSEIKGIGVLQGTGGADYGGLLDAALGDRSKAIAGGDKLGQSRSEGEILQLNNRLAEIGVSLDERRFHLARDIVNERVKEREEASKNLLLATREEQLRAALVKSFTNKRGSGFNAAEFQFLDKGTQEAVQKFNPDSLPPEIKSRAGELEAEQKLLLENLGSMNAAIKEAGDSLRESIKLNTTPPSAVAPPVPTASVNLQFSDQFREMITTTSNMVIAKFDAQLSEMRADFASFKASLRTASAQSAGAGTLS
jgi:TP901 family phage tail tape measure protein